MADVTEKKSSTVLIIEDELDMRFYLQTLLKSHGYYPKTARDGIEGIAMAKQHLPNLVLLDVMMPQQGGALTYQLIKTDKTLKKVPVIMLSAVKALVFEHYLKMLNAQLPQPLPQPEAYVEKPAEPSTLMRLIKKIVSARP